MRPTERKKEDEEERQHEAEQWTKRTTNYIYLQFLRLAKAFYCVRRAVEGRILIQWPEQKLHTVITEGKSRKVVLLGWG